MRQRTILIWGIMAALVFSGCGGTASGTVSVLDETANPTDTQIGDLPITTEDENLAKDGLGTGISPDYENAQLQMNPGEIINEYLGQGYTYVYIKSHILKHPDDGAEMGTSDGVFLNATYVSERYGYSYTDHIAAVYSYWGKDIGWKKSYEKMDTNENDNEAPRDFDPGNFRDMYIYKPFEDLQGLDYLFNWEDYGIELFDATGDTPIDCYIHIQGLDGLTYYREQFFKKEGDRTFGELILVYDGTAYITDLQLDLLKVTVNGLNGERELQFSVNETAYTSSVTFYVDENAFLIEPSEYENARQGIIAIHGSIGEQDSELTETNAPTALAGHYTDAYGQEMTIEIYESMGDYLAYGWAEIEGYGSGNLYRAIDLPDYSYGPDWYLIETDQEMLIAEEYDYEGVKYIDVYHDDEEMRNIGTYVKD